MVRTKPLELDDRGWMYSRTEVKLPTNGKTALNLGPSAFLVLGFIARLGPLTPYELKQAAHVAVSWFWDFPHSQLYVEPARLARLGLLAEHQEEGGRRRKVYSLTDKGREALRAWFQTPVTEQPEIRDVGLLKLVFGGLCSTDDIAALAREQIALHEARLAEYDEIAGDLAAFPNLYPHQVTIRMGFLHERAYLEFWQSILEDPPVPDPRIHTPVGSPPGGDGSQPKKAKRTRNKRGTATA